MYLDYTPKDISRFWGKIIKLDDLDMCWNWIGKPSGDGYGQIRIQRKNIRSHRLSYELTYGSISDGLWVLHKCDNRLCCNPSHLFLGTNKDNVDDRERKGRGGNHKGERHGNHKLTHEQVLLIRQRYAEGGISHRQLASQWGVCRSQIHVIVTGKQWRD